jgi:uncharacterized membrane protein
MNQNDYSGHNEKSKTNLSINNYAVIITGFSLIIIGVCGVFNKTIPAPYGYYINFGETNIMFGSLFIVIGLYFVIYTIWKQRRQTN